MEIAGKFEKVSRDIFVSNMQSIIDIMDGAVDLYKLYDEIKLPKRATKGSAGYDFSIPFQIGLNYGQSIVVPTGIRCKMNNGWVLKIYPRSGLGFKYKIQLMNTVGIIDEDYYDSDNEGHIMIKIYNDDPEKRTVVFNSGDRIAQGIFVEYGIVEDDNVNEIRNGGFGSTSLNTENKKMKTLTKQEAINLHRKMWNWIADETERIKKKVYKYEYFEEMNIPKKEHPFNDCYCCEYTNRNSNIIYDCRLCPIDWGSNITGAQCLHMLKHEDVKGLYGQWRRSNGYQESASLARQIANLPESKDKENTNNGTAN